MTVITAWPLSKEATQMDLNKLSYWEDISKLKYNREKRKVLQIGSTNIKVECILNNMEIKKLTYDRCKADYCLLYRRHMEWLPG